MYLSKADPEDFEIISRFLYRGNIKNPDDEAISNRSLMKAYILADALDVKEFKNEITNSIRIGPKVVDDLIFMDENGPATCKLESLLTTLIADIIVCKKDLMTSKSSTLRENWKSFFLRGGEALAEVMTRVSEQRGGWLDLCEFHEHGEISRPIQEIKADKLCGKAA